MPARCTDDLSGAVDLCVIGGGVAGSTVAARVAAEGGRVVMWCARSSGLGAIETLGPAAHNVRGQVGLDDVSLAALDARPMWTVWSAWGTAAPSSRDFGLHPCGGWWTLDHARLVRTLRERAAAAGVRVLETDQRVMVDADGADAWRCAASDVVRARYVVDATGPSCSIGRRLGARRRWIDRLTAATTIFDGFDRGLDLLHGELLTEAAAHGWWTSVAHGARIGVVFVGDAGDTRPSLDRAPWTARRTRLPGLVAQTSKRRAAGVSLTKHPPSTTCLLVGDAALTLDPLSSSGLQHALESGSWASDVVLGRLSRDDYAAALRGRLAEHLVARASMYRHEQRWPSAPFWTLRSSAPSPRDG